MSMLGVSWPRRLQGASADCRRKRQRRGTAPRRGRRQRPRSPLRRSSPSLQRCDTSFQARNTRTHRLHQRSHRCQLHFCPWAIRLLLLLLRRDAAPAGDPLRPCVRSAVAVIPRPPRATAMTAWRATRALPRRNLHWSGYQPSPVRAMQHPVVGVYGKRPGAKVALHDAVRVHAAAKCTDLFCRAPASVRDRPGGAPPTSVAPADPPTP